MISDTYLLLFLKQLQQEGYSIFVVNGILPACHADNVLATQRVVQTEKPRLLADIAKKTNAENNSETTLKRQDSFTDAEARELQRVLQMSIESNAESERLQLEAALALSLQETSVPSQNDPVTYMSEEEMLDAAVKLSMEAL